MLETLQPNPSLSSPEQGVATVEFQDFARHNALFDAVQHVIVDAQWNDDIRAISSGVETVIDPFYGDPDIRIPTGNILPQTVTNIVYGQVTVGEGLSTRDQICDLDTVTNINETLQATVLDGEHGHIPRIIMPPNPDDITGDPNNVDVWLQNIGYEDTWPIMLERQPDGTLEPNSHDERDYHLGNFALFPREMQDQLSEAARHTYEFRAANRNTGLKALVLADELPREEDPFAFNLRGNPTGPEFRDGINVIDDVSDHKGYLNLLGYLTTQPEGELQATFDDLVLMADGIKSGELAVPKRFPMPGADEAKWQMAQDLNREKNMIGDVTNFNMRHREGRRISPDELKVAEQNYLKGILRVAAKIRGEQLPETVPVAA